MTSQPSDGAPPARIYVAGEPDTAVAQETFAAIRAAGGQPATMHRAMAEAPEVFAAVYNLAIALRNKTFLSRAIGELVILRTTQLEGGEYEFAAHAQMAMRLGLTREQIDSLSGWRGSELFGPEQRAVLAHADALAARKPVPAEVFDSLRTYFSDAQIVELTWTAAFYTAATRFSAAMDMKVEH